MVFERLFKGRRLQRPSETVYEAIVAQARQAAFYTGYGVADRFEERFDLLVLHAHLVIRRLTQEGHSPFAQELFDTLFFDMDRTLRAIGVGDMSVGKRIKDMVRAYYGRTAAYDAALEESSDAALTQAIARNVFGTETPSAGASRLARQVRATIEALAVQPATEIASGRIEFPDPEATP